MCRELLLLLPKEKLSIASEKSGQRKEEKKGGGNSPPFPVHGHPAQPDFSPCSVHFLNKPGDCNLEGKGSVPDTAPNYKEAGRDLLKPPLAVIDCWNGNT